MLIPLAWAGGHADQRTYAGPTHDTSARFVSCQVPAPLALDGACFPLVGNEQRVDIAVRDATGLPVGAHVFFRNALGLSVGPDDFACGEDRSELVPTGAVRLAVWLLPTPGVDSPIACPFVHSQATVGTITAVFT